MPLEHVLDSSSSTSLGSEGVSHGSCYGNLGVGSDCSSVMSFAGVLEDSFDGSENVSGTSDHSSVSSHHVVVLSLNEAGLFHNMEHFVDHAMVVSGSVVDDGMKSVHKLHVGNELVHVTLGEVDMTF